MWSVTVDLWLGNAAAVWSRCWGAVTRCAQETGLSRPTLYNHAQRVEHTMVNEAAGGGDYETLWAENHRLRVEYDWWQLSQMGPEELVQKLSNQELIA